MAGIGLSLSSSTFAVAAPLDYPSWADVQAAKSNQAAKTAEIAKIQTIVNGLEAKAAALGKVALEKGELYNQARDALNAATAKTAKLQSQADVAKATAAKSAKRASAMIASLARTGGGNISLGVLFGSARQTDQLLAGLGTADRLSESSQGILRKAQFDKNAASSLAASARTAEKKRTALAADASDALAAAQKASAAATAQVAQQQAAASTLFAQLATLKDTTASTEAGYQAGVAWEAAQNAKPTPPTAPVINPNPPAPVAGAVAGAIASAEAQLGDPYELGDMGPNSWDCSGLTKASYAAVGVYIGTHSATNQYATMKAAGRLVNVSQLQAGDLLFYSDGGSTSGTKYHTTMYIGGGRMIEAAYPGTNVRIAAIRYGDLVAYAGRPTG